MKTKIVKSEERLFELSDLELSELIREHFEKANPGFKVYRQAIEVRQGMVDLCFVALKRSEEVTE